ncbi:hypothetical protein FRC12_003316 [Ceratobasidium sp. 428]|nr:hypothetical protein FRC12_003316 [Ceratobasidium sp. 428]
MLEMLSQLDTLRISICAGRFLPRDTSEHNRLFLPLKNLSNLRNIHVNYAPGQEAPFFIMQKNPQLIQPILPLPSLETVHLHGVNLSLVMSNALRCETTWRQVTYLCIPFHCVWVHTLSDFARLPNLQHLTLQLILSTDFSGEARGHVSDENGNEHPVGVKLNVLEGSAGSRLFGKQGAISSLARRETDELARQLLKFSPTCDVSYGRQPRFLRLNLRG